MSAAYTGPVTGPIAEARAALGEISELSEPKRIVLDWFDALSSGRLDDAYTLMDPAGGYWVLRQRTVVANSRFAEIFTDAYLNTFMDGIVFTVGPITAEGGQVAVVAEGHAILAGSGRPYDNMYHYLFTVDGPLIRDVCEFADTYRSAQAFAPPGSST